MNAEKIYLLYVVVFTLYFISEILLFTKNIKFITQNNNEARKCMSNEKDSTKALDYSRETSRYNLVFHIASSLLLFFLLVSGFFGVIDEFLLKLNINKYLQSLLYVYFVTLIFSLFNLPFSIYYHFFLEKRFGMSNISIKQFVIDDLQNRLLFIILTTPVFLVILFLMDKTKNYWWFFCFITILCFELIKNYLYPILILPWFNKLSPLNSEALQKKVKNILQNLGFSLNGLFISDESKRSSYLDAYITGLGKGKRIILSDNVINSLNDEEILAIIAHEAGHNKHRHLQKDFLLILIVLFCSCLLINYLFSLPGFFLAFGFLQPSLHAIVIILMFYALPIVYFFAPLLSLWSRKQEFEADLFAVEAIGDHTPIENALLKMSQSNLSNIEMHPIFDLFHSSHPSIRERLENIKKNIKNKGKTDV